MPCKRVYKNNYEANIPNFNEIMNFPLAISVEDNFGNYKKMYMDGELNIRPVDPIKNKQLESVKNDFSPQKQKHLTEDKSDDNKENKAKKSSKSTVKFAVEKPAVNETNDGRPILKSNNMFNNDKQSIIPEVENESTERKRKSILKSNNVLSKENPKISVANRKSNCKVMFSSPLVKNTPSSKSDLRKAVLIEQLKRCQETPILPIKPRCSNYLDDSFQISIRDDNQSLHGIPIIQDQYNISKESPTRAVEIMENSLISSIASDGYDERKEHSKISFQMIKVEDRKKWLMQAKRRSRWIKRNQGVNDSFWEVFNVNDSESVVLKLCEKKSYQTFANVFPIKRRKQISKLGEGSFGEVFSIVDSDDKTVVAKFIPVNGSIYYNGGPQTTFDDIISEIVVAKELSDMKFGTVNRSGNFVQVKGVALVTGKFPSYFQKEWDKSNQLKPSENDNPKKFTSTQKWLIIQFEFAGCPLENFEIDSYAQAYSILLQTSLSLACAESYLQFEHRDLHWGNLLILKDNSCNLEQSFIVNGREYLINFHGVLSTIIDYTFSRIKKGINLVFTDMSKDEDIFLGTGDPQFEVYRQMQTYNKNEWSKFNPKTNIFWLGYLGDKVTETISTTKSIVDNGYKSKFESLVNEIRNHQSAEELIKTHLH